MARRDSRHQETGSRPNNPHIPSPVKTPSAVLPASVPLAMIVAGSDFGGRETGPGDRATQDDGQRQSGLADRNRAPTPPYRGVLQPWIRHMARHTPVTASRSRRGLRVASTSRSKSPTPATTGSSPVSVATTRKKMIWTRSTGPAAPTAAPGNWAYRPTLRTWPAG